MPRTSNPYAILKIHIATIDYNITIQFIFVIFFIFEK
jgi:hypothetical protein